MRRVEAVDPEERAGRCDSGSGRKEKSLCQVPPKVEMRFSSASFSTALAGREAKSPRMLGMMQKLQRLLQPSEIFR